MTSTRTEASIKPRPLSGLAVTMGLIADTIRLAERSFGPVLDLAIRLALAKIFLISGLLKISNWENALLLSTYEYPVSWLNPEAAAYLGVSIELFGSLLLALGLATRPAALAMLILSLVIQFNYVALDAVLFWALLSGWYTVRGPGALSLDRLLERGLADSAVPFAATSVRAGRWISRHLWPPYQLLLRLWLAAAIALTAVPLGDFAFDLAQVLPLKSAAHLNSDIGLAGAALLALGLACRLAAFGLILLVLAGAMAGTQEAFSPYWLATLALLTVYGPGRWSLDRAIEAFLKRIYPQLDGKPAFSLEGLPRVVIVGAGFGGLSCAHALRRAPVQITLIDRQNYHLFQPLLYQVATAELSPGDIATPIRGLLRYQFNAQVLLGQVSGVDKARRAVLMGEKRVPYDFLVLATGARHNYFGRTDWEAYAPGLKRIEDATDVRRRLLLAFEQAENSDDPEERRSFLTFVIVGGGPTGVELAGAIAELTRQGLQDEFRRFDPAAARVILVQSGPRLLPAFPEKLSASAKESLEKLGVEVLTASRVERMDEGGVWVKGNYIPARTVLWAAGVVASPAAAWLGAETDSVGRLKVEADLSVPGLPNAFAIGDTALSNAWDGQPVPGLAPAAKQGGAYVAKVIRARACGSKTPPPFRYRHLGSLATIGRKAAVADFGLLRLRGALAWWLWGVVHLYYLAGARNRASVLLDWFWAYLTFRTGARLITGGDLSETGAAAAIRPPGQATGGSGMKPPKEGFRHA